MNIEYPSDTYKKLYFEIIDDLFAQICKNNINYSLKKQINNMSVQTAIWVNYEKYRKKTLENMSGERLDRHKLASCICGAIIKTKPLCGVNGATIIKKANELLALYAGLNVVKYYMKFDLCNELNISSEEKQKLNRYIKNHFDMQFPHNICDIQSYKDNFANALYWSHQNCRYKKSECFHYDVWAYSKLFYHLELYNKPILEEICQEYLKEKGIHTQ